MRKANKRITEFDIIVDIFNRADIGHLATIAADGWPNVKPLNFAWCDGRIYFHCALEGEKLDDIRRDPRVTFEVALPVAYVRGNENPCRAEFLYRSVILRGRASVVETPRERKKGLDALMGKYQPDGGYGDYRAEKLYLTCVVAIEPEELVGKEELGKGEIRERALALLASGQQLPAVFG